MAYMCYRWNCIAIAVVDFVVKWTCDKCSTSLCHGNSKKMVRRPASIMTPSWMTLTTKSILLANIKARLSVKAVGIRVIDKRDVSVLYRRNNMKKTERKYCTIMRRMCMIGVVTSIVPLGYIWGVARAWQPLFFLAYLSTWLEVEVLVL